MSAESFVCSNCEKKFSQWSGLSYHLKNNVCTVLPPVQYHCPTCNRVFTSNQSLQYHVETKSCFLRASKYPPIPLLSSAPASSASIPLLSSAGLTPFDVASSGSSSSSSDSSSTYSDISKLQFGSSVVAVNSIPINPARPICCAGIEYERGFFESLKIRSINIVEDDRKFAKSENAFSSLNTKLIN